MVIEWEPTVFIKKKAKWPNVAKWIDIIILTHSKVTAEFTIIGI